MRNENKETYKFIGRTIIFMNEVKVISKFCGDNEQDIMQALKGQRMMFEIVKQFEKDVTLIEISIKDNSTGIFKKLKEEDFL